jgi:hypothetical protein
MPHPESYELTPAEKRDLIKLIEHGKPLPEKHRFLLGTGFFFSRLINQCPSRAIFQDLEKKGSDADFASFTVPDESSTSLLSAKRRGSVLKLA